MLINNISIHLMTWVYYFDEYCYEYTNEYSFYWHENPMSILFWMSILTSIEGEYTFIDEYSYEYSTEYTKWVFILLHEYTILDEYSYEYEERVYSFRWVLLWVYKWVFNFTDMKTLWVYFFGWVY